MAYTTLIIKNNTASEIYLEDVGFYIGGNQNIDVTSLVEKNPQIVAESNDILVESQLGNITLNNGSVDILIADLVVFLQEYAVPSHDINVIEHTGQMLDAKVSGNDVLARLQGTQIITGQWALPNGLHVEYGVNLPTGTIADGRVFWRITDKHMFFGKNGGWIDIVHASVAIYDAPIVYEYGYNRTKVRSGTYIHTAWAASNVSPVIMPRQGTIKSIITDSTSSRDYDVTIQFYDGGWQDIYTVVSSGHTEIINGLSIDFDAQERVACKITDGRMDYPHVYLEVTWRK